MTHMVICKSKPFTEFTLVHPDRLEARCLSTVCKICATTPSHTTFPQTMQLSAVGTTTFNGFLAVKMEFTAGCSMEAPQPLYKAQVQIRLTSIGVTGLMATILDTLVLLPII